MRGPLRRHSGHEITGVERCAKTVGATIGTAMVIVQHAWATTVVGKLAVEHVNRVVVLLCETVQYSNRSLNEMVTSPLSVPRPPFIDLVATTETTREHVGSIRGIVLTAKRIKRRTRRVPSRDCGPVCGKASAVTYRLRYPCSATVTVQWLPII